MAGAIFPRMSLADEQRHYLQHVLDRSGRTQTELARDAGIDPSTLSRFLTGEREGHVLTAKTIRKIELRTGFLFHAGKAKRPSEGLKPFGFGEAEAVPYQNAPNGGAFENAINTLVSSRNATDAWVLKSRALELAGYLPGDILLVDLNAQPGAGEVVCAQVYDFSRAGAETIFRIYQPPCLIGASLNPELMRPFIVDTSSVAIKGVVRDMLRHRSAA